jgi:hypothetical protein
MNLTQPLPQQPKELNWKTVAIAAVIVVISVVSIGVLLQGGKGFFSTSHPQPTVTPVPLAGVTLSPNKQVIVISIASFTENTNPSFSVTVTHAANSNIQFPCSLTLYDNAPSIVSSYPTMLIHSDGTYSMESGFIGSADLTGTTASYYAVLQDSNGNKVTSNTVTVEWK